MQKLAKKDRNALLIAGAVMVATAAGVFLAWNASKPLAPEMVNAWVMDKSRWLSQLVDSEIRQIRTDTHRAYAMIQSLPPSQEEDGTLKFQEEEWIYDLALWTRSSSSGVFERVALAINSNRIASVSAWRAKLKLADPVDDLSVRDAAALGVHRVAMNWSLGVNGGLITLISPVHEKDLTSGFVVAHLDARRMQRFFAYQNDPGETATALVDSRGRLIAFQDPHRVDGAHSYSEAVPDRQWSLTPVRATAGWSIAVSHPGDDAYVAALSRVKARGGFLLFAELIGFSLAVWGWPLLKRFRKIQFSRRYPFVRLTLAPSSKDHPQQENPITVPSSTDVGVAPMNTASSLSYVLCGQLRGFEEIIEKLGTLGPDEVVESWRDFKNLVSHRVSQSEGKFEAVEHGTFFVVWESDAAKKSLKCVLDLRRDFSAWMESRKVDGKRSLSVAMGMHQGSCLTGTLLGEVFQDARSLCSLGAKMGVDFLVTQAVLDSSSDFLLSEPVGDVKLGDFSGLTAAFFVKGYKDASGQDRVIETAFSGQPQSISELTSKKWLVNNGSTIEGPLTAQQIACRLFAQEIDFDSECWEEGSGKSATIAEAEIFSGVEDSDSSLWVFDGEIIHGPVSEKFISAMLVRGAIDAEKSYFCKETTLQGWRTLNELRGDQPPVFKGKIAA